MPQRFEKGPLKWLLTLTPGQRKRPGAITKFLAPAMRAGSSLERLGLAVSAALGEVIDPPQCLDAQTVLFGHVMASANAGRLLIRSGYVRAAESQLRAMLEGFALLQCLHHDDARAVKWRSASTLTERRKFEFAQLKKCSQAARDLANVWDSMNEYVHANSTATPAHSTRRSTFGYDIPVGPLFEPVPLAFTLGILNNLQCLVIEWMLENTVPKPAARLVKRLRLVGARVRGTADRMKDEAKKMPQPASDGISVKDQRRAVAHVTRRARLAGRRDVARWLLARARAPKGSPSG